MECSSYLYFGPKTLKFFSWVINNQGFIWNLHILETLVIHQLTTLNFFAFEFHKVFGINEDFFNYGEVWWRH